VEKVYQLLVEDSLPETKHIGEEFEPLDGDFDKVEIADKSEDGGMFALHSFKFGRAVIPDHMPTLLRRKRFGKTVPMADFITSARGCILVSTRVKQVIEGLEPNIHQFFPMSILHRGKEIGTMHYLVICNRLDTLDYNRTSPPIAENARGWRRDPMHPEKTKFVFRKSAVNGHHLWHDLRLGGPKLMSDTLLAAFQDASVCCLKIGTAMDVV